MPFDLDDSVQIVLGKRSGRIDRAVVHLGHPVRGVLQVQFDLCPIQDVADDFAAVRTVVIVFVRIEAARRDNRHRDQLVIMMLMAGMFSYVFKYRHGFLQTKGLNGETLTLTTNTVNVVPLSYVNLVDFGPRIRDESAASHTLPVEIEMITPNEFYSKLGDSIRQRREELGLTQEELGESLGLSRTSVTNIERGRQRLLIDQFQLVCKALDQPADTLLAKAESVLQRLVETRPSELKRMPTVSAYLKKTLVRADDR